MKRRPKLASASRHVGSGITVASTAPLAQQAADMGAWVPLVVIVVLVAAVAFALARWASASRSAD